jgi:hypothetical protein
MAYYTASAVPTTWEATLQYSAEAGSEAASLRECPIKGSIIISTSTLKVEVCTACPYPQADMGFACPWYVREGSDYLHDTRDHVGMELLSRGVEYMYVYENYIYNNISSWQRQGWEVIFSD